MSREAAGGTVITSSFDYLRPEINRPDLFEERNVIRSGAGRKVETHPPNTSEQRNSTQIFLTILTVILSALIFLTIVSFGSALQVYYDSIIVNDIIQVLALSRLYFAITILFITIVIGILFWYIYINIRP